MENNLKEGDEVIGTVVNFSPLGANIEFGDNQIGLLYSKEVHPGLKRGDELKFYIQKIREDGKINLTLNQAGYKNFIDNSSEVILNELRKYGGTLPFGDKSDPDLIRDRFNMSKKKFKESLGLLYKKRKIKIEKDSISLIE